MNLPLDRVQDYFLNVMQYDLDAAKQEGLRAFRERCLQHGLIP
jgi:predicted solute-binding protein